MDLGFSKDANPTAVPGSFCNYEFNFGYASSNAPDYPKLGQTKGFLLIGVNFYKSFSSASAMSGDLLWTSKPQGSGAITTCPAPSTLKSGKFAGLKNSDGTQAFTPVPSIQTDASTTGFIVASSDIECPPTCGTGTLITVFTLKPSSTDPSVPRMARKGKSVTVAGFSPPPKAPQKGNTKTLDTLDGRLTHAISAVDPTINKMVVWTSHTVAGGAGSELRWYELVPGTTVSVHQSGSVTDASLFVYNGGVSPDRTCDGTQCAHGDSIVIGVTTSSSTALTTVQMVSKIGAGAQSALVSVKAATVAERRPR